MTFDEMMESIKAESPEVRKTIEEAEIIADFIVENDYIQVVRCKDCSFSKEGGYFCTHPMGLKYALPNYFCFHGDRRE